MPAAIRPARATDIDALVAIEDAVFDGDRLSRRSFRRLMRQATARIFVAGRDDRVAGYCLVLFRDGSAVARLYSIATAPWTTGSGIGHLMLRAAEGAASQRGCTTLRLEVREDNARAIRLYEQNGYRRIGMKQGYYEDGAAALRYEKPLGDHIPPVSSATVGGRAAQ